MILMDTPQVDLSELASIKQDPCISIYLPTGAKDSDPNQGRIRLKNLVREAENRLKEMGHKHDNGLAKALNRASKLTEDEPFWSQVGRGIAFLISPDTYERLVLPEEVRETIVVSDRFHLSPLLPFVGSDGEFYLLKVARERPRLFHVTRHTINECEDIDLPADMKSALHEYDHEQQNFHAQGSGPNGAPVYHSQRGGMENEKEKFHRFARMIDSEVTKYLKDKKAPLMLVGVEYEQAIYREINSYPNLLDKGITGKPEDMSLQGAHDKAVEVAATYSRRDADAAKEKFAELKSKNLGSNDLGEVVKAAANGRVDFLLIALNTHCWGTFDETAQQIEIHSEKQNGDIDLLDFAAVQTHQHSGAVYIINAEEIPGGTRDCPLAAGYRY